MLLYIHVPFCRKKCGYCAFYSEPMQDGRAGADMVQRYLAALLGEMRLWGKRLGKIPVETVFFGGGTPSLLPATAVCGILQQAQEYFAVSESAEISIEANPESALADGWLFDVRKAGVNRLSLGVQSFDDAALSLLGRCHDARSAEAAFHTARSAGFTNISLDFMWGLPGRTRPQAQREWLATLHRAADLQPEHISAYGLTLEPDTPLAVACAEEKLHLAAEDLLGSMYLAGAEFMEERGFMQYEISNFARMGFACRHNLGYWQGKGYLGIGPAATSTLNGKRWTNPEDITAWQGIVAHKTVGENAEDLGGIVRLKEALMLGLRMSRGLNLKEWQSLSGYSFLKRFAPLVKALQENGLAATRSGHFRLTKTGMLVSDAVMAHFFERLDSAD